MRQGKGMLRTWRRFRDESGQMLVLMGAGLAAFIAIVGLSVDVGQVVFTRTDLQKVADAAAFAGAQDLPSSSAATTNANNYVGLNASNTAAVVVISQTYNSNDTIQVTATRRVDYAFLRVVGLKGTTVSAKAKVRVGTYNGGNGIVPWGLVASSNKDFLGNNCFNGMVNGAPTFKQNQKCILKYGAGSNSGGDFGALALDPGARPSPGRPPPGEPRVTAPSAARAAGRVGHQNGQAVDGAGGPHTASRGLGGPGAPSRGRRGLGERGRARGVRRGGSGCGGGGAGSGAGASLAER